MSRGWSLKFQLRMVTLAWLLSGAALLWAADPPQTVLIEVNGRPITQQDLESLYFINRVAAEDRDAARDRFVEELIDRRLITDFLASRDIVPAQGAVDGRLKTLKQLIERGGHDYAATLAKVGVTEAMLRDSLALPLAWQRYVASVTTQQQLQEYWENHRRRLDGTKLRVSQIVRTARLDAERKAARELLATTAQRIAAGEQDFAAAARELSQSPSRELGGDVGWVSGDRGLHPDLLAAAYRLAVGMVSEPIDSPLGVHLLLVTEEQPGQLSLEDARRGAERDRRTTVAATGRDRAKAGGHPAAQLTTPLSLQESLRRPPDSIRRPPACTLHFTSVNNLPGETDV
ncbi:MAG: peptidylprolyl isomerase [Planctomycetaceae bacterium]